jgi:2-methylisocitrate lyase-like PEP mutase family enzyme
MKAIGAALDVPLVSNQLHGGKTPILPQAQLAQFGFAAAIYPTAGLFAATKALAAVYDDHVNDRPVSEPLYGFHDFVEMIGFQQVWDFDAKYADFLKVETTAAAA